MTSGKTTSKKPISVNCRIEVLKERRMVENAARNRQSEGYSASKTARLQNVSK